MVALFDLEHFATELGENKNFLNQPQKRKL